MTSLGIILLILHYPKVRRIVKDFTDISRIVFQNHSWNWRIHSPDKELRYHRTVIVTAAVHQILDPLLTQTLRSEIRENVKLLALGRCQPLYISFRFKQGPVFLLNSRLVSFIVTSNLSAEAGHLVKLTSNFCCLVP